MGQKSHKGMFFTIPDFVIGIARAMSFIIPFYGRNHIGIWEKDIHNLTVFWGF